MLQGMRILVELPPSWLLLYSWKLVVGREGLRHEAWFLGWGKLLRWFVGGVEDCDVGEEIGASLCASAFFDPVELGEFTLGFGCSFESGSKRQHTLDTHVELMIAPCILFLLAPIELTIQPLCINFNFLDERACAHCSPAAAPNAGAPSRLCGSYR